MDARLLNLVDRLVGAREQDVEAAWQFDPAIRAWRSEFIQRFGYAPDLDDPDYNYRRAIAMGLRPEYLEADQSMHWVQDAELAPLRERVPLKSPDHPTAWMGPVFEVTGTDPREMSQAQWEEAEAQGALTDLPRAISRALR
jgi:hypothetical protein